MNNLNVYKKMGIMLPAMFLLLLFTIIAAVALGAVYVPLGRSFRIILDNIGLIDDPALPQEQVSIIFRVRLPRVIVACVAGAALSACGAVMQGLFRNPMADPECWGIQRSRTGCDHCDNDRFCSPSIYTMPLFAAVGALCTVTLIYLLALRKGKIAPLTLILSGIAVSTFIGAVTQFILIRSNTYEVRRYVFWTMGGLSGMMWEQVRLITFPVLVLLAVLMMFSRELNLLQLGEEEAQSLGLEPSRTRKLLLLFTSLITAVAISVCGPVSFVGLIVPHMVRLIAGPDHRLLIPASALGGAIFLTGCDILGRLPADGEIHVGIITAILGAPYFLYLLIRTRRVGGAF